MDLTYIGYFEKLKTTAAVRSTRFRRTPSLQAECDSSTDMYNYDTWYGVAYTRYQVLHTYLVYTGMVGRSRTAAVFRAADRSSVVALFSVLFAVYSRFTPTLFLVNHAQHV